VTELSVVTEVLQVVPSTSDFAATFAAFAAFAASAAAATAVAAAATAAIAADAAQLPHSGQKCVKFGTKVLIMLQGPCFKFYLLYNLRATTPSWLVLRSSPQPDRARFVTVQKACKAETSKQSNSNLRLLPAPGSDRNFPCQTLKIRNVSGVVMGS
jgi:hypothetical protein